MLVRIGGGKTIDCTKLLATHYKAGVLVVPTATSTDAPTGAMCIVYSGDGAQSNAVFNPKNPDIVFVDTEIIANAAAYPENYAVLKEYARQAFDDYNFYSDATDEEAVTCGGYAAMALSLADPVENFDIGLEFLQHSDFEHAITSHYFVQDFAKLCTGENLKKVEKYLKEC